jgi:hypothetical protein
VTSLEIATGAVGTDELSNNSVTSIKIGDNQVIESKIFTGAVTETKLGTGAVTETKIGTGAVTETKLGTGAVTTVKIAASAVDSTKIAADAVNTSELVDNAVTAAKIASGAVGSDEIATGAVGSDEIATAAVGADEIATGAVGSDEIATGAVNSDELATGAVIEAKIGTGAVTEGKIGTGAVTETKLGTGAVTETKIANDAVTAAKIATGAVGADELASTAVTPGAYTSANITVDADGRITAAANGSGGGGTPAGSTGQIQYNNAGAFGASSNLFWDIADSELGVGTATPAARIHAVGAGTISATDALLLENSALTDLFKIGNDGSFTLGQNTSVTTQASTALVATGQTNQNFVISPAGTGAFIVGAAPDGTNVGGGNARGGDAIDITLERTNSAQVASGSRAINIGTISTSSGSAAIAIGHSTQATGTGAIAMGGAPASGNVLASGTSAIAMGLQNTASASYTTVTGGTQATASLYGQNAYSAGRFGTVSGNAQRSELLFRREITGKTQTELFLDGASLKAILPASNRVWNANVQCSGVVSSAGNGTVVAGDAIVQTFDLGIKRIGAATSLIGTVETQLSKNDTGMAGAAFLVDADDDNTSGEALRIQFTPATNAGTTTVTRCHCVVKLSEVGY